jgi:hypothetical protein
MSWLSGLTDDDLLVREAKARSAAQGAPLRSYRLDIDGHRWVEGWPSYAARGNEWCELHDELKRRGLVSIWKPEEET